MGFCGGRKAHTAAEWYRAWGSKARARRGSAAHQECRGVDGEARGGRKRRRHAVEAGGRRGRGRRNPGAPGLPGSRGSVRRKRGARRTRRRARRGRPWPETTARGGFRRPRVSVDRVPEREEETERERPDEGEERSCDAARGPHPRGNGGGRTWRAAHGEAGRSPAAFWQ